MKFIIRFLLVLVCANIAPVCFAMQIEAKMLANGSALLLIDGKQHLLREGATSPEGIMLVSSNVKQATIQVDGKRKTIELSRGISTQFQTAEKMELRIASSLGGHYRTKGLINGVPVSFLVDTGASLVSMGYRQAEQLRLDYRAGKEIQVSTANGLATAYEITLPSVSVGNIVVREVAAAVVVAEFAPELLLGNSYLSKVDIKIDQGVLVIKEK